MKGHEPVVLDTAARRRMMEAARILWRMPPTRAARYDLCGVLRQAGLRDLSWAISVSEIALYISFRRALSERMREIAEERGLCEEAP